MASVTQSHDSQTFPTNRLWLGIFTPEQQQAMRADDLMAGRSVSAVLISVIGLGFGLMLLTVYYVIR